ncbi:hypothetical protein [Pedobacter sp. NJ-S-72]
MVTLITGHEKKAVIFYLLLLFLFSASAYAHKKKTTNYNLLRNGNIIGKMIFCQKNDGDYSSGDFEDIANIGLARFLTSAKQQIHSLNLGGVISQAPYQLSLTPAINTHGTFSGQIVNEVSLNLAGGYMLVC